MKIVKDKKGVNIKEFDVLKIYHYTAALRRKKCYMYKWVQIKNGELYAVHLSSNNNDGFFLWPQADQDTRIYPSVEIVQSNS